MALITPDYLQTKSYAAKRDRRVNQALLMQEGIVHAGDFAVTQRGAGANMSVDVSSGESWVDGDSAVDQGFYHVVNDATVNVAIANNASGNPRIDTLVLKVNDSADAGSGTDIPALEIIQGTPTAAATLANLKGVAAVTNTALVLSYILVANGAVKIENAQIGALRDPRQYAAQYGLTKTEPYAVAGAVAQYAHGRPLDYVPSVRAERTANQEIPNNTLTAMAFNGADAWDTDVMHDAVTNNARLVCKTPGIYMYNNSITWASSPNSVLNIRKNGAVEETQFKVNNAQANLQHTGTLRLGYGDYIEVVVLQVSGAAVNVTGSGILTWQGP